MVPPNTHSLIKRMAASFFLASLFPGRSTEISRSEVLGDTLPPCPLPACYATEFAIFNSIALIFRHSQGFGWDPSCCSAPAPDRHVYKSNNTYVRDVTHTWMQSTPFVKCRTAHEWPQSLTIIIDSNTTLCRPTLHCVKLSDVCPIHWPLTSWSVVLKALCSKCIRIFHVFMEIMGIYMGKNYHYFNQYCRNNKTRWVNTWRITPCMTWSDWCECNPGRKQDFLRKSGE